MEKRVPWITGAKKSMQVALLVGMTIATSLTVATNPAQARAQSCQSASVSAILDYRDGTQSTFSCTGTYYPFNKDATKFRSRGWSGYITYSTGRQDTFCNNDNFWYPDYARVTKLVLSPTKLC
ncbi:hypothetical protein [Micromonospora sp. WMMD987]|jgi:hypothetical protein|uniref:hypothetical protein n=1 Tax=Micromonospora TaxID=1873 RepID=UPI00249B981D|nr:hypothetical protein [Micromonospora sp. WMMD987]WFE93215.1 hypothetical protein O7612_17520 [Micromonospora sp. WMMD987]